jgi:hypothetical protein
MNSNFIIVILILIILYLYFFKYESKELIKKTVKINPKDFNPAIHHPACL